MNFKYILNSFFICIFFFYFLNYSSSLLNQLDFLEKSLSQSKNNDKNNEKLLKDEKKNKKEKNSTMKITFVSSQKVLEELTQKILSNFINQIDNGPYYFYNIQTDATPLLSNKEELHSI